MLKSFVRICACLCAIFGVVGYAAGDTITASIITPVTPSNVSNAASTISFSPLVFTPPALTSGNILNDTFALTLNFTFNSGQSGQIDVGLQTPNGSVIQLISGTPGSPGVTTLAYTSIISPTTRSLTLMAGTGILPGNPDEAFPNTTFAVTALQQLNGTTVNTASTFNLIIRDTVPNDGAWTLNSASLTADITAVPEPSSFGLLAVASVGMTIFYRRRARKSQAV